MSKEKKNGTIKNAMPSIKPQMSTGIYLLEKTGINSKVICLTDSQTWIAMLGILSQNRSS